MTLDEALTQLRELDEPVPKPDRLPTEQEVGQMEQRLGVKFHPDYRKFLLTVGNVTYGTEEPASITRPGSRYLPDICNEAWSVVEVPQNLLPFCENNGNCYCIDSSGKIVYWDHNGTTDESWPNLATWIEEVWIGEEME